MGLERLAQLAEFVEDYEALGFNAEDVHRLAGLRKSLSALNIDPERLEDYVRKRGSLDRQLKELKEKVEGEQNRLEDLGFRHRFLLTQVTP